MYAKRLARRGYSCFAIDYRLAPKHKSPAQIDDCRDAVRWIRQHASRYKTDPGRIGAIGYSAGGHLVAMLGVSGGVKQLEGSLGQHTKLDSRVAAVIDFCGPTDFLRMNDVAGSIDHDAADSPESTCRKMPIIGSLVSTRRTRAAASSVPSQTTTCPAC